MKSWIEKLLPIISIILLVLGLFKIIDSYIALSVAVLIGGVSSILNGYSLYIKNKKKESISDRKSTRLNSSHSSQSRMPSSA